MRKLFSFLQVLFISLSISFAQSDNTGSNFFIEEFGSETGIPVKQTEDLFTEASTWTSLTAAPNFFGRSTAGVIGDYLYIHTSQNATSLALAFHIPTGTWSTSTPCNFPAFNSAFTVANGELYKLSGSGNVNAFEKFTPSGTGTGTWTTLIGGPSSLMNAQNSMVWDGGNYIYVSSSGTSSPYTPVLQRYHITNGTWEARTGSLFPRRYAGMAYLNGYIYMLGGLLSDGTLANICQRYNVATDTWEQIASLPEDANFTKWSVTADGNYVYLIGSGGGFSTYPISDKVYYYNPGNNTWTLESTLPAVRGLAIGLFMPGYFKLFFGGGNDGTSGTAYQTDTWEGTGGPYIPVELSAFSASAVSDGISLSWSTASELNNSHFEIERSSDNETYIKIGTVNGYGTTTVPQNYIYKDKTVNNGTYYYRLKQVDFDGTFSYSNTVEAVFTVSEFQLSQNFPNPFNPATNISFMLPAKSFVSLKVFDMLGRLAADLINEELEAGVHEVTFNASRLSSGTYIYKIQAGDAVMSKKMILMK